MRICHIFALTALLLVSCTAATGSPTATPSPSRVPPVTFTPVPTDTPSSTVTSTPANAIPDTLIFNGYLLAPYDDPECQLPCWQGLVIGESGREDVQEVFARLTGVDGYDFFKDYEVRDNQPFHRQFGIREPISPDRAAKYVWDREPGDGLHALSLVAMMDESEEVLEGLEIFTGGASLTPQYVLTNLGAPSNIYVSMNWYYEDVMFPMTFVYSDKGLAIFFSPLSVSPLEEKDGISYATYCLNDKYNGSTSYIVEPFDGLESVDFEALPLLYRNWIADRTRGENQRTIEELTDLTIPDIIDLANSEENACIDIRRIYYYSDGAN